MSTSAPTASHLEPRALARNGLRAVVPIGLLVALALLAPGLGDVRALLADAQLGWIALAVALQVLSCLSYVLMLRPVMCPAMPWRGAQQLGWSSVGAGALVPASGAAGLALGAWAVTQAGMPAEQAARRSVALFLIKSMVNFVAVAVLGGAMALGLLGPPLSLWLTALPAGLAAAMIALVLLLGRLGPGTPPPPDAGRAHRGLATARRTTVAGTREAIAILRSGDVAVLAGTLGYWLWDNAVLWATFHAFGVAVDPSIVLLGYLIGQLGGLLPIPGGIGGIDGGLVGSLVLFGAPAAAAAAAVLAYRVILFWVPLIGGAIGFRALRRTLAEEPGRLLGDAAPGQRTPRTQARERCGRLVLRAGYAPRRARTAPASCCSTSTVAGSQAMHLSVID